MVKKININKGFTLVELLVVISIIGILSSFAIVSLNSARSKARDALRKGDMAQLRTALNLYYDDNERYPICDNASWNESDPTFGSIPDNGRTCYNNTLMAELTGSAKPLLMKMPKDPKNPDNKPASEPGGSDQFLYRYISNTAGDQFVIVYYLEEDITSPQIIRGF